MGPSAPYCGKFCDVGFGTMRQLGLFLQLPVRDARPSSSRLQREAGHSSQRLSIGSSLL